MADRSAWLAHAWLRYHAGQLTLAELQAMVRDHRKAPAIDTGASDA